MVSLTIQGVPYSTAFFSGVIEGRQTNKKNTVFLANFTKKILKNQGCILGKIFVSQSCSQLNKLSNSMHNSPVYGSFQAVQVRQSRNFNFFYPFFGFGGHFGIKKVPLTYMFLIFFKILVKFPLNWYWY